MNAYQRSTFVLMADDDPDDRLLFQEAFLQLNTEFHLSMAASGHEVIKHLENSDQLPALIVLDYNMPVLNGAEVIQQIRRNKLWEAIPIVIFSTSTLNSEDCIKFGALACYQKPSSLTELTVLVGNILSHIKQPDMISIK